MEKKSTHEIKITYNHYKTEPPRSTFMIERIITSDDTEIYKDIQSVDMHAKEQASIFSQFENCPSLAAGCQNDRHVPTDLRILFHTTPSVIVR